MLRHLAIIVLGATLITGAALADPPGGEVPLRDLSHVAQPAVRERAVRVRTARVVYVNYELVRADFPELRSRSDADIDRWIEAHTVVSEAQAGQTEFNSRIDGEAYAGEVVRPKDYGRAGVVDVGLDVKGYGSDNPRYGIEDGDPRTGTMTLGEAIREWHFAQVVDRIVERELAGEGIKAVGLYAVVSGGFDVIHRNGQRQEVGRDPAGFVLRQPHARFADPGAADPADRGRYSLLDQAKSELIERVLRRYGITSVGAGRGPGATEGGINIQGTRDGKHILDYGNFLVYERFPEVPVTHFYGEKPLIEPGPKFVQPDPMRALPVADWGSYREGVRDSKLDKPWVYGHQTAQYIAERLRAGDVEAARRAADQHLTTMVLGTLPKLGLVGCAAVGMATGVR